MRFQTDDVSLFTIYEVVVEKWFPELEDVKVKLLFDTKLRKRGGAIVLGLCKLARDMERFLTKAEVAEGYDYFIIIDKKTWKLADRDDRVRLMRHECRHVVITEKGHPKLRRHDIEDFIDEIKLNKDNPTWAIDLAAKVRAAYGAEKRKKKKLRKLEK
jgi:hypothetical protein